MNRADRILYHPLFRVLLAEIAELERERPFCGHGIEHLLDVARLAQLYNLEEGLGADRELLSAAALLHDLGRAEQYRDGTPHEQAAAALARPILTDCDFTDAEQERICAAISAHRGAEGAESDALSMLLHRADKRCRPCFLCPSSEACYWPEEKRNRSIE